MKFRLPIRYRFAMWINLMVIPLVIVLSLLFYSEFRQALDRRVLLQLTSIKQLKRVQIQEFLSEKLDMVQAALDAEPIGYTSRYQLLNYPEDIDSAALEYLAQGTDGIHDLSTLDDKSQLLLGFKATNQQGNSMLYMTRAEKIQEIVLERAGMGETGETYLVGEDSTLRSHSRFYPEKSPLSILAATEGVLSGIRGIESTGIFPDYRGVQVYSSYGPLHLHGLRWTILSEIDEQEALEPLHGMQRRLIIISLIASTISIIASLLMARQLTKPVFHMKSLLTEMSRGNFRVNIESPKSGDEIQAMFDALAKLVQSITQAMDYAEKIGEMKLEEHFEPLSTDDVLGKSLLHMRDRLKIFKTKEEQLQLATQRALLKGQEQEQSRLSRELHDGLGPLLTSLKLLVQRVQMEKTHKSQIKDLLDQTITEVRRMTYNLMPQALLDFGVGHALQKWITLIREATEVHIQYTNAMDKDRKLSEEINVSLYRIAQEAITNSIKHAEATEIRLSITQFEDYISFFLKDNGKGFDTTAVYSGVGLVNMKERCRVLNGTFTLSSSDGGTSIEVEIPIAHA